VWVRGFALITALLVAVALSGGAARAACSEDRLEMRGDFGTVRFNVVIADTPQERAQGLMHVPEMPRMAGMLFVYERPQSVSFWMENTLILLDMIFADETGLVRRIHENAVPLDRTPIPGGDDIRYVLEINGGMAAMLGLSEGDQMRHPAIVQDGAAWPCAAE
jgi:uncharacterized membrane protein (UPF0127 family)